MIAVVPVRAGSKGLPGKNLRGLAGKPLYQHAVLQGLRFADRCIVTTNIPEIINSKLPERTLILERSAKLSSDQATMSNVIKDIILRLKLTNEILLLLQATSPLRTDNDIKAILDLHTNSNYKMVMTVVLNDSAVLKYGMVKGQKYYPIASPEYCFENRQNLPKVYRHNGAVYAFSALEFTNAGGFPSDSIGTVVMPKNRSVDIDTLSDFREIENYLAKNIAG